MHGLLWYGIWYLAYWWSPSRCLACIQIQCGYDSLLFDSHHLGVAIDKKFVLEMNEGPLENQSCWKHPISCHEMFGESWTKWVCLVQLSHQLGWNALWRVNSIGTQTHRVPLQLWVKLIFWCTKTGMAKTEPATTFAMAILCFCVWKHQLTFSVCFFIWIEMKKGFLEKPQYFLEHLRYLEISLARHIPNSNNK